MKFKENALESIDTPEFRKLCDAYHCSSQEGLEDAYEAIYRYVDNDVNAQLLTTQHDLPPLPEPAYVVDDSEEYAGERLFTHDQMQSYARKALAQHTQSAGLTDEQIFDIYQDSYVEHEETIVVRNEFTEQDEYAKQMASHFSPYKFADKILTAQKGSK